MIGFSAGAGNVCLPVVVVQNIGSVESTWVKNLNAPAHAARCGVDERIVVDEDAGVLEVAHLGTVDYQRCSRVAGAGMLEGLEVLTAARHIRRCISVGSREIGIVPGGQVIDRIVDTGTETVGSRVHIVVCIRHGVHIRRCSLIPGQAVGAGALDLRRLRKRLHNGVSVGRTGVFVVVRVR